jgi:hypothetical protein
MMVSSIAIAAAESFEPEEKPRLVDEIAASSQPKSADQAKPSKNRGGAHNRQRLAASPHAPRGPSDDLEERIGPKLLYSIAELARKAARLLVRMLGIDPRTVGIVRYE